MTLSTLFVIKEEVEARAVFDYCCSLVDDLSTIRWTHEPRDRDSGGHRANPSFQTTVGQGLPAWTIVSYGSNNNPLDLGQPDYVDDDPDWNEREDDLRIHRAGYVQVDWDTGYGYTGPNGGGCSDLHAWLVATLGAWCEERGLRYTWRHEFTGQWFDSVLDVYALGNPEIGRLHLSDTSA